jgi:hypothetical protein
MDDYVQQVRDLLQAAGRLPLCQSQLDLLEEAVQLADAHQDVPLGIQARYPLMYAARQLLRGDVLAVAFAWCLAQFDRNPAWFAGRDLHWEYCMVIGQMANLDTVTRQTLEDMLEDFGQRLHKDGRSESELLLTRLSIAPDLGDRELAVAAVRDLQRFPPAERGTLRDRFECAVFLGDDDEALALGQSCLRAERRHGDIDASVVCQGMLLPLLRRGRVDEALPLLDRCLGWFNPEVCYYWHFGDVLIALTLTGRLGRAVEVYERCQRAMTESTAPLTLLHFALDAGVLFERLAALGKERIGLRLPSNVPIASTRAGYAVTELRDWLRQEAAGLSLRFDRRNGNDYFAERIRERLGLQRLALPVTEPAR